MSGSKNGIDKSSIGWRDIFAWYGGAVVLCAVGTSSAYGPLSSEAWRNWLVTSHVNAPVLDIERAVVSAVLAIFALYAMDVVPSVESARRLNGRALAVYERVTAGVATFVLLVVAFIALPYNFHQVYAEQIRTGAVTPTVPDPLSFGQIAGPYVPYALYVIGLWLGIVFPVLLALMRGIRYDAPEWRRVQAKLDIDPANSDVGSAFVTDYKFAYKECFAFLKDFAGHYLPVFLAVITGSLIEQLTVLRYSVLEQSADLGKMVLWVLWLPVLGLSIVVFTFVYDAAVKRANNGLHKIIARLQQLPGREPDLKDALSALTDLREKESAVLAVWTVLKSGTIGVYSSVVVIGSVTSAALQRHENWAAAFFPKALMDWVSAVFGKHP